MATAQTNKKLVWWKWILLFIAGFFVGAIEDTLSIAGNDMSQLIGWPILTIATSAIVLMFYALFVKLTNRCWPTDLKLRKLVPHTLLGMLVGAVYMVLVVSTIVAWGHGSVSWSDFSGEAQFSAFMTMLAVAVGEEIFCRGIIFRMIDERWNTRAALIVSALFFGFGHLSNDNATWWSSLAIAIEAGLLLAAAYKWSGTLWVPIGIHWAWNYVQGNVFGLAVSGINIGDGMLATSVNGPDIITGGAFGPEASIITVVLGALYTLVFLANRYSITRKQ